jgi:hypothetical protein
VALQIRLPAYLSGQKLNVLASAIESKCRLANLRKLTLATYSRSSDNYQPKITAYMLWASLRSLLPLHNLKNLWVGSGANLLESLDLVFYQSIASGLPALETLRLESPEDPMDKFVAVPTHCLAAFCSMLPSLRVVVLDAMRPLLPVRPRAEWACPQVRGLRVSEWQYTEARISLDMKGRLLRDLQTYFPNSNAATTLGRLDVISRPPRKSEHDDAEWVPGPAR